VPDGVIDLDRIILSEADREEARVPIAPDGGDGLITFGRGGPAGPLFRETASLVAAAVIFLVAARVEGEERLLSLMAPDDLAGLATGLVASLLSGATLECHGLFQADALAAALATGASATHLVAPGWLEPTLAQAGIAEAIASKVLVHPAPVRFKAKTDLADAVDVVALGEAGLIVRARDRAGRFALSLDGEGDPRSRPTDDLFRVRRSEDGAIWLGGLASEVRPYRRGGTELADRLLDWRNSGFKADLFAGIVIGVL
jgi:hypothetical protein